MLEIFQKMINNFIDNINSKTTYFLILVFPILISCGKKNSDDSVLGKSYTHNKPKPALTTKLNHSIIGKSYAEKELKSALKVKSEQPILENTSIVIKDSLTAINIAESILFSIYDEDNITRQRPYETYFIDKYWVILGTHPEGYLGGTFLIIIDSRNSKIIKITHGE